jgi:hypothetical protein
MTDDFAAAKYMLLKVPAGQEGFWKTNSRLFPGKLGSPGSD